MSRLGVSLLLGGLLTGCASVPRDGGFADVRSAVAAATGHQIEWDDSVPIAPATSDESVLPLLAGELSADQAVQVALRNNRDLQATLEGLGMARADLIAASTVRNPLVEGELRFPGEPTRPFEIVLTQTLLDILQLHSRRQVGRAVFEAAKLEVSGAVLRFAADVRGHYYELGASRQVLAHRSALAAAAQAAAELTLRQHDAGNVTDLDLEREQALYEQAKLELARAGLEAFLAEETLRADLGLVETQTRITLPAAFATIPPAEEEIAIEDAVEGRMDVRLLRQEVEAGRSRLPLARASFLDELALGVHREREPDGKKTTGPAAVVPIPLFDRGAAARGRAIAALRQAEQRLAALTLTARSEIRSARERVAEARGRAAYLRQVTLPRRQRILQLSQLEYNAMLRGPFDLVRARQDLAAAEAERVMAERDYWVARTDLEIATQGVARFSTH